MPTQVFTCINCGTPFRKYWYPKKKAPQYCCPECQFQHRSKIHSAEVSCRVCGKSFRVTLYRLSKNPQYCSLECFGKAKEVRITFNCAICGKAVEDRPSIVRKRVYCSQECLYIKKMRTRVKRTCAFCKSPFEIPPNQAKNAGKYCSRKCKDRAKRRRGLHICETCGKPFERILTAGHKYCSQGCQHEARKKPKVILNCEACGKEFERKPQGSRQFRYCSRQCAFAVGRLVMANLNGPTSIEAALMAELDKHHTPYIFQQRLSIWLVDVALPQYQIAIEADGDYWHSIPKAKERDQRKNDYLAMLGWKLFRFTETEIRRSASACIEQVLEYIKQLQE